MHPHTDELKFRKSSYSGTGNNCLEVADLPGEHLVRDTQNRDLGALGFAGAEWAAALGAIRTDQV